MEEKEERRKYKIECLKEPMLLQRLVLDGLDEVIVGEDAARKVVFLASMGSLVINCNRTSYNLMVNSESGAGKDHLIDNILKILPQKQIIKRTRISPTVLNYWHNAKKEPWWTWDGKVLYLEDCSNAIFNSEVFKVFTSGGSHATVVKDQEVIDIPIKGKPVLIVTSASANPHPEMVRRFIIINLDESKKQTLEVMQKWADHAARGFVPDIKNDYKEALVELKPRKIKVPFSKNICDKLNHDVHMIMRTHFSRFMDFIKASAVLHQYAREIDSDGFVIANEQDYNYAREVILETASNNKMVSLTLVQKEVLEVMKQIGMKIIEDGTLEKNEIGWSLSELTNHINVVVRSKLWDNLNKMVKFGFLIKETIKDSYTNKPYATFYYKEQEPLTIPKYKELFN